ncbi:hypothetical protein B9479_002478 [Cryptococcus floricola]|uniref:SPX domain-containing protein n=1 Tax=Cryptococcus floricola TaxID=2591691 RepID=A0A5D3AZF6_9TREE|nr:hypothetical protein B9479_002478 [Cryptococcus floricola]
MKFGKTIQSQQVPGWGDYYLNYKALKKIINSYAAGRPASDASLLSLGQRPPPLPVPDALASDAPPREQAEQVVVQDLEPLPPQTAPPENIGSGLMSRDPAAGSDKGESFKAHRDVFFFTLQRELEKINQFYLVKERDLRLRLLTLLSNRERLLSHSTSDDSLSGSRRDAEWNSLEEGWRLFERDLGKLQGFIEVNATGFRKILKKWDKRSKSSTKELYIERQVEVQPCFNREFIAKLSDIVAANLLDIQDGSEHLNASFLQGDLPEGVTIDGLPSLPPPTGRSDYDADASRALAQDALTDLEDNLVKALSAGHDALVSWLRLARSRQHKSPGPGLMRILWRCALHAPEDDLALIQNTIHLDYAYVDTINKRSPLHQASISGSSGVVRLCLLHNPALLEKPDAYGRRPLHCAAMHGHAPLLSLLLAHKADPSATDMDGYTPLMHAIQHGHLPSVLLFVQSKIPLEPTPKISTDLIPLSLACEFGQVDVARVLLREGARVVPNSEGLYPQHFAAKAGHEAICRLLVDEGGPSGGGKDRQDKYNLWTPLHHAAIGGTAEHLKCAKVLVGAGCDVNAKDEYGKSPGWYAAWFGHVECLNFLLAQGAKLEGRGSSRGGGEGAGAGMGMENLGLAADPQMDSLSPGSDIELDPPAMEEFELIPSLSLPPPIIPLRVYGHEFLAKRCLIQISLGHRISSSNPKRPPIKLYSRSGTDAPLHLWSSLKLVMTSKQDTAAVPHSVILPLADEREVFSFHAQDLSRFTLELSLYPTFGSKVIARAIILPSTFSHIPYHTPLSAPLLDHNLKTIGEVALEASCIKPFEGAQLEIGGRVETYWKSKVTPSNPGQDHAHLPAQSGALGAGVFSGAPAVRPPAVGAAPPTGGGGAGGESALVTASSLSGEYVHVVVQVTKDGVPVVYPHLRLPVEEFDLGVSDVTFEQYTKLASRLGLTLSPPPTTTTLKHGEWYTLLATTLSSLADVLSILPNDIGVNFRLQYARGVDAKHKKVGGKSREVNEWVDRVLEKVYEAGKNVDGSAGAGAGGSGSRKIIFSSFDPTVCTALNWKQPNYAVFFASYSGISRAHSMSATFSKHLIPAPKEEESDVRCLSVREAVNFAKSRNLLGVILESSTLAAVPSLVASVKDAGLLLATFGDQTDIGVLRQGASDGRTVDAFVIDGIMTLTI